VRHVPGAHDKEEKKMNKAPSSRAASKVAGRAWRPTLLLAAVFAACAAVGMTATATAANRAESRVTIEEDGLALSGDVYSKSMSRCAANRKVIVFLQKGERGGGDDQKFATTRSSSSVPERGHGPNASWATGDTGRPGRFYAKVRRNEHCKGDTSRTVRVGG
jgi:hypothetical protein